MQIIGSENLLKVDSHYLYKIKLNAVYFSNQVDNLLRYLERSLDRVVNKYNVIVNYKYSLDGDKKLLYITVKTGNTGPSIESQKFFDDFKEKFNSYYGYGGIDLLSANKITEDDYNDMPEDRATFNLQEFIEDLISKYILNGNNDQAKNLKIIILIMSGLLILHYSSSILESINKLFND